MRKLVIIATVLALALALFLAACAKSVPTAVQEAAVYAKTPPAGFATVQAVIAPAKKARKPR